MSDTIETLTIQNRYLSAEVARLNNNLAYVDQKLDEEMKKTHTLYAELRRLQEEIEEVIRCGNRMSIKTGQFACAKHYQAELKDWADLTSTVNRRV